MRATELFQIVSWGLYALLFLLTTAHAVRRPSRASIDVALFFGVTALIIVLSIAAPAIGLQGPVLGSVNGSLLMALPYLLLRLVADFAEVPTWIMRLAEAGLALSVASIFLLVPNVPPAASLALVIYFVAVTLYSSYRFVREAVRTRGVTRRRMQAVAIGSALLGLVLTIAGAGVLAPAQAELWAALSTLCGAASGVSYYLGFTPPGWLRRAWQEPDLRAFLARAARLTRFQSLELVANEIEKSTASALGAPTARVALYDPPSEKLRVFFREPPQQRNPSPALFGEGASGRGLTLRGGVWEIDPRAQPVAGTSFLTQQPKVWSDLPRQDPSNAAYHKAFGARTALTAPISAGERRLGVLMAYGPRQLLFAESDLELLQVLADQSAIIFESRALVEEAAKARAQEEANRLKDEFLATVSHDLKNPLAAVRGTAQVLRRRVSRPGPPDLDRIAAGLDSIDLSSRQMAGLVEQLLDYARLQMDRPLDLQRRQTDMTALAGRCVAAQELASDRHRVVLDTTETELVGDWDEARLERVLQNLLGNARKYSPEGGDVVLRLWREDVDGQWWVALSVTDQGLGIPAEDVPHIFERFHRGANVVGRIAGTGIGLATSRQVVEQHGGTIEVESTEGTGTTVTVRLPLK